MRHTEYTVLLNPHPLVTKGGKDPWSLGQITQTAGARLTGHALLCVLCIKNNRLPAPQLPVSKHKYYNIECSFKLDMDPRIPYSPN